MGNVLQLSSLLILYGLRGKMVKSSEIFAYNLKNLKESCKMRGNPRKRFLGELEFMRIHKFKSIPRKDNKDFGGGGRRLSNDKPSYTITTGDHIHPTQNRTLTIRELARIQSFPDSYKFDGSYSLRKRMIGNAVPPKLAEHLGKEIRD